MKFKLSVNVCVCICVYAHVCLPVCAVQSDHAKDFENPCLVQLVLPVPHKDERLNT